MTLIHSHLKPSSEAFRQNHAHNLALCEDLQARKAPLRRGGDEKARARHAAQGKLFVRDRIAALVRPGHALPGGGPVRRPGRLRRPGARPRAW